MPVLWQPAIQW